MAFAGFSAIVVTLRQGTGKTLTPLLILITQLFVETSLAVALFAMLPPTLAICGLGEPLVWRVSSAVTLLITVPYVLHYVKRRKRAAPNEKLPRRFFFLVIPTIVAVVALLVNALGWPLRSGPGPLAATDVVILAATAIIFIQTYAAFTEG